MSTGVKKPLLNVHSTSDEYDLSNKSLRLSRSPHPYARRRSDASFAEQPDADCCSPNLNHPSTSSDLSSTNDGVGSKALFGRDIRKRRKVSSSLSGSGTEADDESGPFLKGLPAPPARLRKGLKDDSTFGTSSPLLTPSYLDDAKRRENLEAQFKRRASLQSHASTDEEKVLKMKEKFRKRRRAELIRRTTETGLLLCIGCIACGKILVLSIKNGMLVTRSFRRIVKHRANDAIYRHLCCCLNCLWNIPAVPMPPLLLPSLARFKCEEFSTFHTNTCGFRPSYPSISRHATSVRSSILVAAT